MAENAHQMAIYVLINLETGFISSERSCVSAVPKHFRRVKSEAADRSIGFMFDNAQNNLHF